MRLDQGEVLHAEPELHAQIQSAEGQCLDAARAEFRAQWQAKVDRTRRQVARAHRYQQCWDVAIWQVLPGSTCLGLFWGLVPAIGLEVMDPFSVILISGVCGAILAVPFVLLASVGEWHWKRRVEQLERELRELERS